MSFIDTRTAYKLVSSNEDKLREFNRFGLNLTIEKGRDLPEVNGTPLEVIIHKARDAGPGRVVEDTSLDITGMDVGVNVRWLTQQLLTDATLTGKKAKWTTLLGVNTGTQIRVYEGVIHGTITAPRGEGFGFDPIFVPEMSNRTLAELEALGVKDAFSARCFAADAFKDDYPVMVVCLDDITDWTGEYQH